MMENMKGFFSWASWFYIQVSGHARQKYDTHIQQPVYMHTGMAVRKHDACWVMFPLVHTQI